MDDVFDEYLSLFKNEQKKVAASAIAKIRSHVMKEIKRSILRHDVRAATCIGPEETAKLLKKAYRDSRYDREMRREMTDFYRSFLRQLSASRTKMTLLEADFPKPIPPIPKPGVYRQPLRAALRQ
jgi:hypothetical protein